MTDIFNNLESYVPDSIVSEIRYNEGMDINDRIIKNTKIGQTIPEEAFANFKVFDEVKKRTLEAFKLKTQDNNDDNDNKKKYDINELSMWQLHKKKIIIGGATLLVLGTSFLLYRKYKK